MNAAELRIGNITQDGVVKGIIDTRVFIGKLAIHATNVKPIELTEEILLKCGFVFNFESNRYEDEYRLSVSKIDECYLMEIDNTVLRDIKHLHQLQNIYFALTGEELQVNI